VQIGHQQSAARRPEERALGQGNQIVTTERKANHRRRYSGASRRLKRLFGAMIEMKSGR
jgi:hypothetical protein